jgi:hypothetical protein
MIAGAPVRIRTEYLPNRNQEQYRYANLLSITCIGYSKGKDEVVPMLPFL